MDYKQSLNNLRERLFSSQPVEAPRKNSGAFIQQPSQVSDQRDVNDILAISNDWVSTVRQSSQEAARRMKASLEESKNKGGLANGVAKGIQDAQEASRKKSEAKQIINKDEDVMEGEGSIIKRPVSRSTDRMSPGYGEISDSRITSIIEEEAKARGISPEVAIKIYQHEGRGNYQSQIAREGKGADGGKEASYGPYQLFTGGGLGNEYEKLTGRKLTEDNTEDGVVNQIRFALDKAVDMGWTPWYGRGPAGVGKRDGLEQAKKLGNWK